MDLRPSDFEWITTEIMRIADLCCSGRVVSVLEGGYGHHTHTKTKTHRDEKEEAVTVTAEAEVEVKEFNALIPPVVSMLSCANSNSSLPISLSIPTLTSLADSSSDTLSDSHTESESPPVDTPPSSGSKVAHCRSGMDRDVLAISVAAHVRRLVDPYGPHVRINSTSPPPATDISACLAPSPLQPFAASSSPSPSLSHPVSHPVAVLTLAPLSVPLPLPTPLPVPVPVPVPSSSSASATSFPSLHSTTPGPSHVDTHSQLSSQSSCPVKILPHIEMKRSHTEPIDASKDMNIGLQNDDLIETVHNFQSPTQEGQNFRSPT